MEESQPVFTNWSMIDNHSYTIYSLQSIKEKAFENNQKLT